jgi:hypothetical protein
MATQAVWDNDRPMVVSSEASNDSYAISRCRVGSSDDLAARSIYGLFSSVTEASMAGLTSNDKHILLYQDAVRDHSPSLSPSKHR